MLEIIAEIKQFDNNDTITFYAKGVSEKFKMNLKIENREINFIFQPPLAASDFDVDFK